MTSAPLWSAPPAFDHELAQLNAGLRRVIKREFADPVAMRRVRDLGNHVLWLGDPYSVDTSSDIRVTPVGDSRTALFGPERDALLEVAALDNEERSGGRGRRDAILRLAELLGYPRCCALAFADQRDGGEVATFDRLLADGDRRGLPRGNNLFVLDHQLISHFPCDLGCPSSAALAEQTLACAPAETREELHALLTAPITVWDRFRVLVEHPGAGLLTGLDLSSAPRVAAHAPLLQFVRALPSTPAAGVRLCFDGAAPV